MKIRKISLALLSISFLLGGSVFAQKSNVVSAAVAYQSYMRSIMGQNLDKAKSDLEDAKKYIDPTMTNEDTKDDPKANYYNAVINYSMIELASSGKFDDLKKYVSDSTLDVVAASAKKTENSSRWNGELKDFFKRKVYQATTVGKMMFDKKKYKMAFAGFLGAYKLKKMVGLDKGLDDMKKNSIISARHYIDTLKKTKKSKEALDFVSNVLEVFPENSQVAIDGVNIALDINNINKAEELFNIAAKADPKNKALFSTMGSVFLSAANKNAAKLDSMKETDPDYKSTKEKTDKLYAKAESNLIKALEIDPDYADAAYNLGVYYLGRGEKLQTKASNMKLDDPNYNKTIEEGKVWYKKAIAPLETYIKTDPNNASVLRVLFQVYRGVGNNEKAMEYRKRMEAAMANKK